jgi:tetratricopeptide (TPR) repeat protein
MAEAERLYRLVLKRQPRNFAALRFLGVIAGHTGQWQSGIKLLREALKVDPKSAEAHTDLGALQHASRDFEAATAAFTTALRLNPMQDGAHHNLGVVRRDQGRFAEAAASFGAAIGIRPDFVDAWYNLGVAWQGMGRLKDAIFAYRRAIDIAPSRLEIRCALGGLLFEMGDYQAAATAYRAALAIQPDWPAALNGLAAAQSQIDDEDSIETINQTIQKLPNNIYGYDLLGNVLRRVGRFDDAIKAYETALGLPGNHSHSYYGLTHAKKVTLADQHLVTGIQAELERSGASLSASDRSYMHFAMGKALDDLDRCEEAIQQFDLANQAWLDSRPPHRRNVPLAVERQHTTMEFNAMIASFSAAELARLRQWGSASERPILIVGMMRSGTTLIEQILASHPDVAAGGELTFWNDSRLRLRIAAGGVPRQPDVASAIQGYDETLNRISPAARRVTDKMPHNFFLLGMIHGIFPNARIIHCRRNPVDIALSLYFARFARDQDFTYDREGIVTFYREYRRLMAHWRQVIPADRLIDVDYEATVEDQEGETRKILDFCGLDWNDACLSFYKTERSVRTASSWQVRQPIYRSSAARWRRYQPWLGAFRALLEDQPA